MQGCSQLYLEAHGNWRRFLGTIRKQISHVFQKGKKENPGNYKPISLTSVPERVIDQILMEAIFKYIMDKMIRSCQSGYK